MESLGKLKDDFLLKKFQDDISTTDLYSGFDKYASSSQTDVNGEVSFTNERIAAAVRCQVWLRVGSSVCSSCSQQMWHGGRDGILVI